MVTCGAALTGVALTHVALPGVAQAAPLLEPHPGGLVFVGPASPHVTAIFWNPAAAGLMRGDHIFISGVGRFDRTTIDRADIDTTTGEPAEAGTADGSRRRFDSQTVSPFTPGGFIGFSSDLNSDAVTLGLALYSPFGEELPVGNDDLRYHSLGGSLYSTYLTMGVSYRPTSRIIFGFGFSAIFTSIDLRFAQDEGLAACNGLTANCVENLQNAARYRVRSLLTDELSPAVGGGFGFMLKLSPRVWVGGSYMSAPITGSGSGISKGGVATVDPAPATITPEECPPLGDPHCGRIEGEARISFRLPQLGHLGIRYALVPDELHLVGNLHWTDTSVHRVIDLRLSGRDLRAAGIPEWIKRYRGFNDVWSAEIGLEERPPGAAYRVGGQLRLQTSAVSTEDVGPEQVDGWNLELAGGVEYRVSPSWSLSIASSLAAQLPQTVGDSAFSPKAQIDCVQSGYDLDTCEPARDGRAIPTAAGDYNRFTFGFLVGLSFDRL